MFLFTLTCLVKAEAEGDSVNYGQGVSVSFELLAMVLMVIANLTTMNCEISDKGLIACLIYYAETSSIL